MKSIISKKYYPFALILAALLTAIFSTSIVAEPPMWADSLADELDQVDAAGTTIYMLTRQHGSVRGLGYALIVHGAGQHPDWQTLIRPLRQKLPDYGWSTVSVEMPDSTNDNGNPDYPALISTSAAHFEAALNHLKSVGAERIVVIGYGMGARLAVNWVSQATPPEVKAIIMISMKDGEAQSGLDSNMDMVKLNIPILDIIADNDNPSVVEASKERLRYRLQLPQYRQLLIYAADQYYSQQEEELIKRIRGWLKQTFEKKDN
jgi:pimeloyl-ACP methyl ester carboxylesterase